jgi:TonB family protein
MNCRKVKKLLSPYLDNQLSKKEQQLIQQHLNICPKCQQELKELRNLVSALKKMDSYPAPEKIMAKVDNYIQKKKEIKRSILFRPLFASASPLINYLALAFFIGLVALSVSYLYYQIQPFQKSEVVQKIATTETGEAEDEAISKKAAPAKLQKRAKNEVTQDLSQKIAETKPQYALKEAEVKTGVTPPSLSEHQKDTLRTKGKEGTKSEKAQEQIIASGKAIQIKDKKNTAAKPMPEAKVAVRTRAVSVEKAKSPPAEKEEQPGKSIQRATAEEKTLDENNAIDFECQPDIPGALGSLENPILIETDPLLEIEAAVKPTLSEEEAKELKENIVVLELLVDAQGKVRNIKILKSSGKQTIDESIVHAIKQWKFKPFKCGDKSAAVKGKLTFKMNQP